MTDLTLHLIRHTYAGGYMCTVHSAFKHYFCLTTNYLVLKIVLL